MTSRSGASRARSRTSPSSRSPRCSWGWTSASSRRSCPTPPSTSTPATRATCCRASKAQLRRDALAVRSRWDAVAAHPEAGVTSAAGRSSASAKATADCRRTRFGSASNPAGSRSSSRSTTTATNSSCCAVTCTQASCGCPRQPAHARGARAARDRSRRGARAGRRDRVRLLQHRRAGDRANVAVRARAAVPDSVALVATAARRLRAPDRARVLSASHVAFGSAPMEPTLMLLGEAAGTAAALAARDGRAVQDVADDDVRQRLHEGGQVLTL